MPTPPILQTVNPAGGVGGAQINYIESSFQQGSYRPDGQSFVRHVQVAGVDEEDFAAAMLGYSTFDSAAPVPLSRFPPESHPRKPSAVARSVDFVRELGVPTTAGPGGTLEYGGTLLTGGIELAVTYEPVAGVNWFYDDQTPDVPNPDDPGGPLIPIDHEGWRFVRVFEKYDIEQRILPLGVLHFNKQLGTPPKETQVPSPGTLLVPSSVLTIEWFQLPAVMDEANVWQLPGNLADAWASVQGRINALPFFGAAPLTLYCAAPEKELVTMADGNYAWNIKYQFYRRGYDDFVDATFPDGDKDANTTLTDTPNWTRILTGTGVYGRVYNKKYDEMNSLTTKLKTLYDYTDFYNLFRFP